MKNLLIPFDFSNVSINALKYAIKFASASENARINLLYISKIKMENKEENELIQKFDDLLGKYQGSGKPLISYHIGTGSLADTIVNFHKTLGIDLIIMGTRGTGEGVESEITKTSKFVMDVDLAVLVVPVSYKKFNLDKILFTLGEDVMHDSSTLDLLLDVSRAFNATVEVLTISPTLESVGYSKADELNENTLQYYLENFYSHHSFTENEDILEGIDNYIEKNNIDLLAIMPKTHSTSTTPSKGKLTREVTLKSEIPVLILD